MTERICARRWSVMIWKTRLIMTLYSFMNFFVRAKSERRYSAKRELFSTKQSKNRWIFSKSFVHIEMRTKHIWKMNTHMIMLMWSHCKTKLREMKFKRARIKRIISRIKEITSDITSQKRKQGNAYVTKFMSLKNAHTSSHQQESLIEQKIKRYAIKSNNNFRKNPEFWTSSKEFAISIFWTKRSHHRLKWMMKIFDSKISLLQISWLETSISWSKASYVRVLLIEYVE